MSSGAPGPGATNGNPRLSLHTDGSVPSELVAAGATLMVGGFGEPGTPFYLLDAVAKSGVSGLTVIKNDGNEPGVGMGQLLRRGSLKRLITSHIGLNTEMMEAMNRGDVAVDFHPQGILAEKIRCGGVGIPAFLSDIGVGVLEPSEVPGGRQEVDWEGESYLLEPALRADVALLHAHCADRYGNLLYRKSSRNFNPLMAMAARTVIVEVEKVLEEPIDPECIHTPGSFVDHLVLIPKGFEPGTKASLMRAEQSEALQSEALQSDAEQAEAEQSRDA